MINDTHSIINENDSSVDEAHRQQNNSNSNIVTETKGKWVYTNVDQLRNKMNELDILISQENPDFICVTEVLPKATTCICKEISCSSVLYDINGYEAFHSQDGGRGVMIYARTDLNVSVNERLNSLYHDASWCNWKCDNLDQCIHVGLLIQMTQDNV